MQAVTLAQSHCQPRCASGATSTRTARALRVTPVAAAPSASSKPMASVAETATRMRLPAGRVERLLEEEADRRTVARFRQNYVENATLREHLRARQLIDPTLTIAELARRVGTSPIQVERWLGLRPTAAKTDSRGRTYPGRILKTISVENAELARAMGYAPNDIEGC